MDLLDLFLLLLWVLVFGMIMGFDGFDVELDCVVFLDYFVIFDWMLVCVFEFVLMLKLVIGNGVIYFCFVL